MAAQAARNTEAQDVSLFARFSAFVQRLLYGERPQCPQVHHAERRAEVGRKGDGVNHIEIDPKPEPTKQDNWDFLEVCNIPLFYYDYCDSIKVENLYLAFKERMERETHEGKNAMDIDIEELLRTLMAASRDERLATGKLYRDVAGVIESLQREAAKLRAALEKVAECDRLNEGGAIARAALA